MLLNERRVPLNERGRDLLGEYLGTAMLVVAVVGSGIAAEHLTTDPGLRLLINAFATAGALVALITAFAAISNARFNPAVTLLAVLDRRTGPLAALGEVVAQVSGAITGVVCADVMFGADTIKLSTHDRSAGRLVFSEVIATIGLLVIIELTARRAGPTTIAVTVAGYIGGAYFFTSSTSFANPAVTLARTLTDTYTGIAPASTIRFIAAQLAGTAVAFALLRAARGAVAQTAEW